MLSSSNSEYNVTILMKSEMFWAIARVNCCYWKSFIQKKNEDLFLPETLGIFHAAIELFCWILTIGKKKPTKNPKQPPTNQNGIYVIVRKVPSNEFGVPQLFQFYIYIVTKYWWALFCNLLQNKKDKMTTT